VVAINGRPDLDSLQSPIAKDIMSRLLIRFRVHSTIIQALFIKIRIKLFLSIKLYFALF